MQGSSNDEHTPVPCQGSNLGRGSLCKASSAPQSPGPSLHHSLAHTAPTHPSPQSLTTHGFPQPGIPSTAPLSSHPWIQAAPTQHHIRLLLKRDILVPAGTEPTLLPPAPARMEEPAGCAVLPAGSSRRSCWCCLGSWQGCGLSHTLAPAICSSAGGQRSVRGTDALPAESPPPGTLPAAPGQIRHRRRGRGAGQAGLPRAALPAPRPGLCWRGGEGSRMRRKTGAAGGRQAIDSSQ